MISIGRAGAVCHGRLARVLALCLPLALAAVCAAAELRPVVIVPVAGEIEDGLVYVVRRALREAEAQQARAVILHMDTPGGKVSAMEKIMQELAHCAVPVYTYVDTKRCRRAR